VIENCRERMRFVDMIIDPKVEVIELIYQLFVIDVASWLLDLNKIGTCKFLN
jgi:hypothetical protein